MALTVSDWDTAFESVLRGHGYEYRREQGAHVITYVLLHGGVECGRWDVIPPRGRVKGAQVRSSATAIARGADVSMRDFGDMEHMPLYELARHRLFAEAQELVESELDFVHGRGMWADAWHKAEKTPQTREPQVGVDERVKEAHRLIKTREHSQRWVFERVHIDSRTYHKHCKRVTGEEPIPAIPQTE